MTFTFTSQLGTVNSMPGNIALEFWTMAIIALKDIMDDMAALLTTASYRNVYSYPTSPVQTPGTVIGYPTRVDFDLTMGRGGDTYLIPVFFLVGKNLTEKARDQLSDVLAATADIKSTLEAGITGCALRVVDAEVQTVTVASVEYLAAVFSVEVLTQNA